MHAPVKKSKSSRKPPRQPLLVPSRELQETVRSKKLILDDIEQSRGRLPKWPADIQRFPSAPSVQSDSGYSSATNSSRQIGGSWAAVTGQDFQPDHTFPTVAEEEQPERLFDPWSEAIHNYTPQPRQRIQERYTTPLTSTEIASGERYVTSSGTSSNISSQSQQNRHREIPSRPHLGYVERMGKDHLRIPAVVKLGEPFKHNNLPLPRMLPLHPFLRQQSSTESKVGELGPMDEKTQRRKSLSDIALDTERRTTTKTTQTNVSTGKQSNGTSSTQSTRRTIWSGASAGSFSTTSAGSLARGVHRAQQATIAPSIQTISKDGSISYDDTRQNQNVQAKRAIEEPLDIIIERNLIESSPAQETEDVIKSQTLYPQDQSMMGTKRTQLYILRFADYLYSQVQGQLTDGSVDVITRLLPELLTAFALKLGQMSQFQIKRDAMYFVHTHRYQITQSMRALFHSSILSREELLISSQVAETDDECSPEDVSRYLDAVTKDPAFEWLTGKLGTELDSAEIGVSAMKEISSQIRNRLPPVQEINRQNPLKPCKVTFDVECDILGFIQEQEYKGDAAEVLPKVITLTGSIHNVQATTCEQYLVQTWPAVGCNLLRTIQGALRKENATEQSGLFQFCCKCKFEDRTEIRVSIGRYMKVEAIGTIHSITEIGEQIGWLAAAFRSSSRDLEILFCHPEIISFQADDGTDSQSVEDEFEQAFTCRVDVTADHVRDNLPSINGQCWQQVFNNPVVVMGYPIKPRRNPNLGVGLEMPFDMMTTLADARYLTTFENKTLVKGFSTILIPTAIHGSIILWHLLVSESGARISYRDPRIQQGISIEPGNLMNARHILGWCMKAQNNIGSLNASYDITGSGLSHVRAALTCEGVELSVGAGNYFKVGTSFKRGKRDRSICSFVSDGYVSLVEHIGQHHVVLYDVKQERACLSDGLPVLLHLVRTSLKKDEKEDPDCLFTNRIAKLKESPSSVQGTIAAKAVLFDSGNRLSILRLIGTKVTEQIIERITEEKTVKEIVRIKEVTYYRLENRVEEICLLLEKLIDETTKAIKDGILRSTPKNILSGFDFVGVATRSNLRHLTTRIPIPGYNYGWTDLVDSLEAITLFGNGFGELIKPRVDNPSKSCDRCGYEASLPSGKNRLAVCVDVLEKIIERNGNKDMTGWRLTDDIYWHLNEPAFKLCCTRFNQQRANTCTDNWIQILSSKNIYHHPAFLIPTNAVGNGAVIFGHGRPQLVPMSRNIREDKNDSPPNKISQSETALKMSVLSPVIPNESSEASENQVLDIVSSTTPYKVSSDGSGLDSNLSESTSPITPLTPDTLSSSGRGELVFGNLSGTTSPITPPTPDTLSSSGRGEIVFSNTPTDQQSPGSDIGSKYPEIVMTSPQNALNKLSTPSPKSSFGKIKEACSRVLKKLKRPKRYRTQG